MDSRNMTRIRMMARLALLAGICLVTSAAQLSCNSNGTGMVSNGDSFSTQLTLRAISQEQNTDFVFGVPIRLDFEIDNLTDRAAHVQFADSHTFDFVIMNAGTTQVRWKWSDGQTFTPNATELTFEPFASKTFTVIWSGALADGSHLPVGNYQARGLLVFDGFTANPLATNEMASSLKSFSVH